MYKEHYICLGECEGVSNTPGTCQAKDCNHYGESLVACGCEDGDHRMVSSDNTEVESSIDEEYE
jgi:hypothetical protein